MKTRGHKREIPFVITGAWNLFLILHLFADMWLYSDYPVYNAIKDSSKIEMYRISVFRLEES